MSKYKAGDKFIIEIADVSHIAYDKGEYYECRGIDNYLFSETDLDRLEQYTGMTLRDAYDVGFEKGLKEGRNEKDCKSCMDAYAKAKQDEIKVGDEVTGDGDGKGIVTLIKGSSMYVMWADGSAGDFIYAEKWFKKTGRHYDIKSILEQLKGAEDEASD